MQNDEDNRFNGFKTSDYILIPRQLVDEDMFRLSSWELRLLFFFFQNLYSLNPRKFIDEDFIITSFISTTRDLSDTHRATPNIVKVTLASLIKKNYLKTARKTDESGKTRFFYGINFKSNEAAAEASPVKPVEQNKIKESSDPTEKMTVNHSASIQFIDEDEIKAGFGEGAASAEKENLKSILSSMEFEEFPLEEKSPIRPLSTKKQPSGDEKKKVKDEERLSLDVLKSITPQVQRTEGKKDSTTAGTPDRTASTRDGESREEKPKEPSTKSWLLNEIKLEIEKTEEVKKPDVKEREAMKPVGIAPDVGSSVKNDKQSESPSIKDRKEKQSDAAIESLKKEEIALDKSTRDELSAVKTKEDLNEHEASKDTTGKEDIKRLTDSVLKSTRDEALSPIEKHGKSVWEQLLSEMHVQIENYVYDTWLKPAEYYKYKDGVHLIKVGSTKFYEKFEKQWGSLMREILMAIDPDVKFEFYSE